MNMPVAEISTTAEENLEVGADLPRLPPGSLV